MADDRAAFTERRRDRDTLAVVNLALVLQRIAGHLDQEGQPFALIGALGLAALGLPRATLDLDLLVPAEAQPALIEFMEGLGYRTLHRSVGYSNHLHDDEAFGRVDFVYARGETRRRVFDAATEMAGPGGVRVLVPRPEHLAAMKILAMKNDPERRHQELADVARLLQLPGIDRDEVRGYFEQHGLGACWDELT